MEVKILGVPFKPVTMEDALFSIAEILRRDNGTTRTIVTGNPLMVMTALRDPEFMHIMTGADLVVPDGTGILWAAKKLGYSLPERVTGVDLVSNLLRLEPSPGFFFLGGKPGIPEKAKERVKHEFPNADIRGTHHGYFNENDARKVVEMIRNSGAGILFVGMGSPRQEKFIWKNRRELGVRVALGVGGVLDVLAGEVPRAPGLFQKAGLEWLFRLLREPRRLGRDLDLVSFVVQVLKESSHRKKLRARGEM